MNSTTMPFFEPYASILGVFIPKPSTGSTLWFQAVLAKVVLVVILTLGMRCEAENQNFTISFFCKCALCTGKYHGLNRTASGTIPTRYRTAANNSIPFGVRVYIPGYGWRVIEDRMSGAYPNRIDIYVGDSHQRAKKLGIKTMTVWIERK